MGWRRNRWGLWFAWFPEYCIRLLEREGVSNAWSIIKKKLFFLKKKGINGLTKEQWLSQRTAIRSIESTRESWRVFEGGAFSFGQYAHRPFNSSMSQTRDWLGHIYSILTWNTCTNTLNANSLTGSWWKKMRSGIGICKNIQFLTVEHSSRWHSLTRGSWRDDC